MCVFHWNSIPSHTSAHPSLAPTYSTPLKLLWARPQTPREGSLMRQGMFAQNWANFLNRAH